jgi:tetratricopeptide (TPR) repeat protein
MRTVFPHLSLWYTGSYTVALGSVAPPPFDVERLQERFSDPAVRSDLDEVGIDGPVMLLSLFLMANEEIDRFAGEGPLNTDDRAFLEHSAARAFGYETTPVNLRALLAARDINPPFGDVLPGRLEALLRNRDLLIEARIATYEGRFEDSMERYREALSLFPEDGIAGVFLDDAAATFAASLSREGDGHRQAGDLEAAGRFYRRALELDADQPRAHNGLGLIHFTAGRYDRALYHFDRALGEMGAQVQIKYNRTLALLKTGKLEEAEEEIDQIEELERDMNLRLSRELRGYLRQAGYGTKREGQ